VRRILPFIFLLLLVAAPLAVSAQEGYGYQTVHVVQYGDTLYSIGRFYGVTPEAIAAANGIYNYNYIFVGQRLIIPTYAPPQPTYITHYVGYGETLASIARYYGTSVAAIAQLNGIYNVNRIYVGQRLLIPQSYYPPQPQVTTYYVRYGDTLGRIARYFGVPVQTIIAYNGIYNPNRIYAGQVLYIPLNYW
jgi:spore germination protein